MKTVWMMLRIMVYSAFFAFTLAALVGCNFRGEQATEPEAGSAEGQSPKTESKAPYVVQDLPGQSLTGKVLLEGKAPAPIKVPVNQDREVCGTEHENYPVRVEKGGIVDAVVWIDNIHKGKPFGLRQPVLDQKGCTYLPHIVLMQPGDLKVESKDPVPHNVHTYADSNRNYNISMNQLIHTSTMSFLRPERVDIRCDLHGWMNAYAVIAANPYYTLTSAGGEFKIDQVPPGHYKVKAWQETLGEVEKDVIVEAAKPTAIDFTFQPK